MELFHQFHPLFLEQLNAGSIGLCRWMEPGTTVETALPELYDLVNDKKEWRAIIIRLADEKEMASFPAAKRNPYDFDPDRSAPAQLPEQVPLIRLTRMLGGVPAPEITFRAETLSEDGKDDRIVYIPVEDAEAGARYDELCRRYRFDGVRPSEILLLTVQKEVLQTKEDLKKSWEPRRSDEGSAFWKRNGYPSMCRFLTFSVSDNGVYRRRADMFRFWSIVLLLAVNRIDPSSLQAYQLYRVEAELSDRALTRAFQSASSRAVSAEHYIERKVELQREAKQKELENTRAPNYRMNVSVTLQTPVTDQAKVPEDLFTPLSEGLSREIGVWDRQDGQAKYVIREIVKSVERSLDEAAMSMHGTCGYPEETVRELNRYQLEDMEESLEQQRFSILRKREALPIGETELSRALDASEREVRRELFRRFTGRPAGVGFAILAVLALLSCVPGFLLGYFYAPSSLMTVAFVLLALLVFGGIGLLIGLLVQRSRIRLRLKAYNSVLNQRLAEMAESAHVYSDYLSTIATHIHGRSYLNALHDRALRQVEMTLDERYHLRELRRFRHRLKAWGKALHLTVDYSVGLEHSIIVDTESSAVSNPLYALETGGGREVPLNRSGARIQSPVSYVTKLVIQQEELYDG